jgi:hypothetical protein
MVIRDTRPVEETLEALDASTTRGTADIVATASACLTVLVAATGFTVALAGSADAADGSAVPALLSTLLVPALAIAGGLFLFILRQPHPLTKG